MTAREKLARLLCKAHNAVTEAELENDDLSYADALEIEADVLIAHGVVISKMETTTQKWISVDERLPEKNMQCLCRYVFETNDQSFFQVLDYYATARRPHFQHELHALDGLRMKVTHWMPLPEEPKEE